MQLRKSIPPEHVPTRVAQKHGRKDRQAGGEEGGEGGVGDGVGEGGGIWSTNSSRPINDGLNNALRSSSYTVPRFHLRMPSLVFSSDEMTPRFHLRI